MAAQQIAAEDRERSAGDTIGRQPATVGDQVPLRDSRGRHISTGHVDPIALGPKGSIKQGEL